MSILNLKKTFNNPLIVYYCIKKITIECICLTKLTEIFDYNILNYNNYTGFEAYKCDKVKIISIYDIHRNIITRSIQSSIFEKYVKINDILENLKEKKIYFFKTFIAAFLNNNSLNGIKYNINCKGFLHNFSYDNVIFDFCFNSKEIFIKNSKENFLCINPYLNTYYANYNYKNVQKSIFNENIIKIRRSYNSYEETIYCNKKNLKIFKIKMYSSEIKIYEEERNNNNEIIMLKEKDCIGMLKEEFVSNNKNPPFSKQLGISYIKLINFYNEKIININKQINFMLKKEKKVRYNLLLKCNLDFINFK